MCGSHVDRRCVKGSENSQKMPTKCGKTLVPQPPSLRFHSHNSVAEVLLEASPPSLRAMTEHVTCTILSLEIQRDKEKELLAADFVVSPSRLPADRSSILFRNS